MFDPKKLGEEADEMIRGLNQQPTEGAAVEDQAVVEEDQAIAHDEVVDKVSDDQGVAASASEPEVEVARAPEVDVVAELRKQAEAAEQKWRVLQGMINKKDQELDAMREMFAQMAHRQEPAAQAEQPTTRQKLVTDKDVEEYGKDMIDLITRASREVQTEVMESYLAKIDAKLKSLEGTVSTVQQTSAKSAQDRFFDSLTQAVPDWQQLNVDESFLAWLDEADPFAGASRLDLLQDAVSKADVRRAATFFNTFKQLTAPAVPTVVEEEEEAPAESARAKLERKVAPGRSKTAAPAAEATKRTWTTADITRLYDDKMQGRISAKEFDKLERDLFAAQSEGRIKAA